MARLTLIVRKQEKVNPDRFSIKTRGLIGGVYPTPTILLCCALLAYPAIAKANDYNRYVLAGNSCPTEALAIKLALTQYDRWQHLVEAGMAPPEQILQSVVDGLQAIRSNGCADGLVAYSLGIALRRLHRCKEALPILTSSISDLEKRYANTVHIQTAQRALRGCALGDEYGPYSQRDLEGLACSTDIR